MLITPERQRVNTVGKREGKNRSQMRSIRKGYIVKKWHMQYEGEGYEQQFYG